MPFFPKFYCRKNCPHNFFTVIYNMINPMSVTHFKAVASAEKEATEITENITESTVDYDESHLMIIYLKNFIDAVKFAIIKWSTLISLAQIIFMFVLISKFGMAPEAENPFLGPSVEVLVRYGAKDAELIIEEFQYWRLCSAIMLHAGINHILGNVTLQLLISGHLEFSWGLTVFLVIYFSSGIVGYMLSCCFLYKSISVGSSGSIMGILTAWLMDVLFCVLNLQSERDNSNVTEINNQFIMFCAILTAVLLTLALSFESGVDWGSHSGGCFYGFLWGCFLFSDIPKEGDVLVRSTSHDSAINYLKQPPLKTMIRTVSVALLFCTPIILLIYMNNL